MTTVARISGGVTIHQYHRDHHPPHFHAVDGDDEALIEIAEPLKVFKGGLKPGALGDVRNWASPRRALLALNWVDALALAPIKRIP